MDDMLKIKEKIIDDQRYRVPVFKFNEDSFSLILRYSKDNIERLFLTKLSQIVHAVEFNTSELTEYEIISDEISESEKGLPVLIREDTGFNLGKLIHLQSFVHHVYLYYRLESDEIAIVWYKQSESQLRLIDRAYFAKTCQIWLKKLKLYDARNINDS